MTKSINICIIHYNTPEMTECLIKSINKYVKRSRIFIFDNSDKNVFSYRQPNIVYFDNTKGQFINFDNELVYNYIPLKNGTAYLNNYVSFRHCISVQKCIELINDNFILLDSDVLIKQDISSIVNDEMIFVGSIEEKENSIPRVLPYCLYINVNLCKQHEISFFNENYMHGLTSAFSNKYDTGAYFYKEAKEYNHNIIDINNYIIHYKAGSWLEDAKKYIKYEQIPPEMWLNNNRKYWSNEKRKNKVVVYTAITGNYDNILLQTYVNENFDYVCFTDDPTVESGLYKILPIPEELSNLSKVKQQRCLKVNPHKYLKNYEISIWLDGNVELLDNPLDLIDNEHSIFIPQHPLRNCIYAEGLACIKAKKDTADNINRQLSIYRNEGYPENNGLVQSNIIIRKHNSKDCIRLMEDWWSEIEKYSHRDQLSFNYALWKNPDASVLLLDKNIYRSKYFYWNTGHGDNIKIKQKDKKVITTNFGGNQDIIRERIIEVPKEATPKIDKIIQQPDPKIDKIIQLPTPIKRIFY